MSPNCTQSLQNGKSCNAPAMNGSSFCRHHDPQRPPRPVHEESRESESLVLPPLRDKYSILLALDEVIHALAEGRIKLSFAETLLSGIKLVSRIVNEVGIFAHEAPVRRVVDRVAALDLDWVHSMHGGTLTRQALPSYLDALRREEFAYRGLLLGRQVESAFTESQTAPDL